LHFLEAHQRSGQQTYLYSSLAESHTALRPSAALLGLLGKMYDI